MQGYMQTKEPQNKLDEQWMKRALGEAQMAYDSGEVPVGAVVVADGRLIASAHNMTETLTDVTAHAEMQAITAAANALGGKYLQSCTLYVTLEPCVMCAGALAWAQVGRIVIGANDEKRGYTKLSPNVLHPKTKVTIGVLEDNCKEIIQRFFKERR